MGLVAADFTAVDLSLRNTNPSEFSSSGRHGFIGSVDAFGLCAALHLVVAGRVLAYKPTALSQSRANSWSVCLENPLECSVTYVASLDSADHGDRIFSESCPISPHNSRRCRSLEYPNDRGCLFSVWTRSSLIEPIGNLAILFARIGPISSMATAGPGLAEKHLGHS